MTVNERIKQLRTTEGLTMAQFGAKIGFSKQTISNIENGNRNPTEHMLKTIESYFDVNPDWLRKGEGDIRLKPSRNELIASYIKEILKTDSEQKELAVRLIEMLAKTNSETLEVIYNFCMDWAHSVEAGKKAAEIAPAQKEEGHPLGTPEGVADAEAAYEKTLGIVPEPDGSAMNTTEDIREQA